MPKKASRQRNPHAVALGSRGGKKGGPNRARKLSSTRRKQIARQGAKAANRKRGS